MLTRISTHLALTVLLVETPLLAALPPTIALPLLVLAPWGFVVAGVVVFAWLGRRTTATRPR
jgi:hypothetical protein